MSEFVGRKKELVELQSLLKKKMGVERLPFSTVGTLFYNFFTPGEYRLIGN